MKSKAYKLSNGYLLVEQRPTHFTYTLMDDQYHFVKDGIVNEPQGKISAVAELIASIESQTVIEEMPYMETILHYMKGKETGKFYDLIANIPDKTEEAVPEEAKIAADNTVIHIAENESDSINKSDINSDKLSFNKLGEVSIDSQNSSRWDMSQIPHI